MLATTMPVLLWILALQGIPQQVSSSGTAADYFSNLTNGICERSLAEIQTLQDWKARREEYRRQLLDMLGLWPLPEKTNLEARVTGRVERPKFVVEKLHFQSMPNLYVTANLYLPRDLKAPAPAVLYLCGHSRVFKEGVAYGNKANYQHHPAWFAENGYVALIIDTLDLGEIEGEHHGTYRRGFWWWPTRGYTPAGVETWNAIRALDYLESRSEVDPARIGVTGRSGGGAYTWFLAGVDDRPAALVPVAGITDLKSHVIDGAIEGHCDCMYQNNTYAWDYYALAALAAPRPLLLANSDKDKIFPLDGVLRVHHQLKRIYDLHGAAERLGLFISEGPHGDTQELQVAAFRWMNRWLKKDTSPVFPPSYQRFEPAELKVFASLPADQINTRIHGMFVPAAAPRLPAGRAEWERTARNMMTALREKVFRNWPTEPADLRPRMHRLAEKQDPAVRDIETAVVDFQLENGMNLQVFVARVASARNLVVRVWDEGEWKRRDVEAMTGRSAVPVPEMIARLLGDEIRGGSASALVFPRGGGLPPGDSFGAVHSRRRLLLLGSSLEAHQVWDVRAAIRALRTLPEFRDLPLTLEGTGDMAAVVLFAAIFEPSVVQLRLLRPPSSLTNGGSYPDLLRHMDLPHALALVLPRQVRILESDPSAWGWPAAVAKLTGGEVSVSR